MSERSADGEWGAVSESANVPPRLPPRWFIRAAWAMHRALYVVTLGKFGVWLPKPGGWGTLRLTTTGRHTGKPRSVMVGYLVDGTSLVVVAMNGWGAAEPAWWLNLQADPMASVVTADWRGRVIAAAATGARRERLWARWREIEAGLDAFAALRPGPTAVVILEPQKAAE